MSAELIYVHLSVVSPRGGWNCSGLIFNIIFCVNDRSLLRGRAKLQMSAINIPPVPAGGPQGPRWVDNNKTWAQITFDSFSTVCFRLLRWRSGDVRYRRESDVCLAVHLFGFAVTDLRWCERASHTFLPPDNRVINSTVKSVLSPDWELTRRCCRRSSGGCLLNVTEVTEAISTLSEAQNNRHH